MRLTPERVRALLATAESYVHCTGCGARNPPSDGLSLRPRHVGCPRPFGHDGALVSAGGIARPRDLADLAADVLTLHAALATERERCARLCDATAARWRAQRDHDNAERAAGRASNDDVKCAAIIARQNEAAALAAEIRGGDIAGCP